MLKQLLVLGILLVLAGYQPNRLQGKWVTVRDGYQVYLVLEKNHHLIWEIYEGTRIVRMTGIYYLEGNKLGFSLKEISEGDRTVSAPDRIREGPPAEYRVEGDTLLWREGDVWTTWKRVRS